jgi:hypothetical protein
VACVFKTLSEDVRNRLVATLSNLNAPAAEIELRRQEMQPAVRACVAQEGWTKRDQSELGFAYAWYAANLLGVGNTLQSLGVDPAEVEALYDTLPPATVSQLARLNTLNEAEKDALIDYMRRFLATTGPAREAPARAIAFEFLSFVAQMHDVARQYRELP